MPVFPGRHSFAPFPSYVLPDGFGLRTQGITKKTTVFRGISQVSEDTRHTPGNRSDLTPSTSYASYENSANKSKNYRLLQIPLQFAQFRIF